MTLTPERIAEIMARLKEIVPPTEQAYYQMRQDIFDLLEAEAPSTSPPASGVTEEMVEAACARYESGWSATIHDGDKAMYRARMRAAIEAFLASKPIAGVETYRDVMGELVVKSPKPTPIAAPDEAKEEIRARVIVALDKMIGLGETPSILTGRGKAQMAAACVNAVEDAIAAMSRVRPTSTERSAVMREALQMVFDDLEESNDASGSDGWKSKELAEETIKAVIAALSQSPPPRMVDDAEMRTLLLQAIHPGLPSGKWHSLDNADTLITVDVALAFGRALQERMK